MLWAGNFLLLEGQQKKEAQPPKAAYNVTVNAVTLAVTVQDRKGRYINDLQKDDFAVYENNEKKEITYFQHDEKAPVSFTVLLDVSGSMALENKFEEARQALRLLAKEIISP
ncbi:MAG: VWA domain-containing protein, partial [Candidatus Saccharicenans sp.]